jgi:peptidoglycan/LPS O-acetylase OafA/YrhL
MQMRSGVFRFHLDDVARIFAWMSFFFSPKIFDYAGSMTVIAGVTWTLKYEWIYYVSIPIGSLVYRAIHRWCGSNMLSLIIVGVSYTMVFRLIEMLPFKIMSLLSLSYVYFPLFFLGMLAVELVKIERIAQFLRSRTASVLGAVAFLLEVSGSLNSVRNIILDDLLLFLFYAPVVAGNGYFGILSARCSIALGNLTYTVYLMHGIVLFVFFNVVRGISSSSDAIGYWYALPVVSIAVVIVAALVHYFIEEKGIAWGRSLVGKYVYGTRANAIG